MAAFHKDQFLCSICLEVFTHPVTIPCGHNFCKNCITRAWTVNKKLQCPICKEAFDKRPELRINTVLSEMASGIVNSPMNKVSLFEKKPSKAGDVPCDVCNGTRKKAVKSCLVCLISYCENHLEPHQRVPGLRRHKLIDPLGNLEERMCIKHNRPLELFCKTDQECVCLLCVGTVHKKHIVTSVSQEYELKKEMLERNEIEIQQMIEERELKIQKLKECVEVSKEEAEQETAAGVQVFTALIQTVESSLAQLIYQIEEKQKTLVRQAETFIMELEEEIFELMKRSSVAEQLSHTEDHLHFLQTFKSLNSIPLTKDWTEVRVQPSYEGTVRRAVSRLEETVTEEMKKLTRAELKRVQQFSVDVILAPDTAGPSLNLSEDEKQVSSGDVKKNTPNNPNRFSSGLCVLGKQPVSSGRFYYEVQVTGKTTWALGVARGSIIREGGVSAAPKEGLWVIQLKSGTQYEAPGEPCTPLFSKSQPEKVGVFVNYNEGLVSFYDVDAGAHIFSFTGCDFTEPVYPFFSTCTTNGGTSSTPLVITPVTHM
ncbi:E3 ubiquitin-protein ligase TRIM39-like [Pholidichthys leucotaenia]